MTGLALDAGTRQMYTSVYSVAKGMLEDPIELSLPRWVPRGGGAAWPGLCRGARGKGLLQRPCWWAACDSGQWGPRGSRPCSSTGRG
jgi:hypothetical protein